MNYETETTHWKAREMAFSRPKKKTSWSICFLTLLRARIFGARYPFPSLLFYVTEVPHVHIKIAL